MTNLNTENLPPEIQDQLAGIIQRAGQYGTPAPEPVRQPPTMMDLLLELKEEVTYMRETLTAQGQVTEAVGQAVGQIYLMLQAREQQEVTTNIEQESTDYYSDDF
jgi:hypothetical protein